MFNAVSVQANATLIKGTVIDKETKTPLPRASVSIPALRIGAVSDSKGNFTFQAPAGDHLLEARYVGYETYTQRIVLKEGETREVRLELSSHSIQMNQIVVVGLTGEVDRTTLGNQISSVSGRDVANVVSPSAIDAISGRVPGVNVTRNSGTPGAGTFITMRGRKSILGSSEPLYVVDGVILDNTSLYDGSGVYQYSNRAVDINPQDIESMEILKGASAAAIYGSAAANGVVLITTKRGKLSSYDKPAQINFSTSVTVDQKSGEVPLQTKYGQRVPSVNNNPGSNDSWGAELAVGTPVYEHSEDPFRTAISHEQSLTISGGVPQFDYLINGTFAGIQGYVEGSSLERTNIRANLGISILPGVSMRSNSNFVTINNDLPQDGSNTSGILLGSLRSPPEFDNTNYLKPDGTQRRFGTYDNPIWTQKSNIYNSKIERFIHSTEIKWQPFTYLSLDARVGMDRYEYKNKERLAVGSASTTNRAGYIADQRITNNKMNYDFTANYQRRWLDDNLFTTFVIGSQVIWDNRTSNYADAENTLPFYDQISAGAIRDGGSSVTETKTVGYFGQLTNTWQDKLSLTLAMRRDGSSTFGSSKKFHYYPKVGLSYNLSREEFMAGSKDIFSNIRLRGSWGQAGSPSLPYAYATNFLYGTAGFFDPWGRATTASRSGQIGIKPGGGTDAASFIVAGTDDILPELTEEIEFGIDLGFFEDRLNFEATYYHQDISDMILSVPVPTSTGYDQRLSNAGEMWNKGIELTLRANPFATTDFSWNTILNYSTNKNEVTKLEITPNQPDDANVTLGGGFVGIQNVAMVGQPLGVFFGYGWLRDVDGKILYSGDRARYDENLKAWVRDQSAEPLEDDYGFPYVGAPKQDVDQKIIGNSNPDFMLSWRNEFTIMRDFTVSFLIDAVMGQEVWNGTRGALYNFGTHGDTEDRYDPWFNFEGDPVMDISDPNALVQATKEWYYRAYSNGFYINEPHIVDGSYIKFRELTLEYRWRGLQAWNINTIAFNFSVRNLLTISEYDGYDPEVNTFSAAEGRGYDYFTLPQVRSYRFAISINY
ncbi:MAG: SusC/RagA family TonB-linked outer membrane protein [Candidatus Kapabacteria bacterium]|nr:SusC/RagA family TonB-linked outer membrane protein [Candidatus Kapabacteria bacterium]